MKLSDFECDENELTVGTYKTLPLGTYVTATDANERGVNTSVTRTRSELQFLVVLLGFFERLAILKEGRGIRMCADMRGKYVCRYEAKIY